MKRKLNEDQVPVPVPVLEVQGASAFSALGLDSRLLQAIQNQSFSNPTLVQSKAIPLALEGKDILGTRGVILDYRVIADFIARSKTGSGKTAAYVLPILESILRRKTSKPASRATTALILVPTRELAQQVSKAIAAFSAYCAKDVRTINLTQMVPEAVQRSLLADSPDIVIATPARASLNINSLAFSVSSLQHLVIDEADLVLSYGYNEDLQNVANAIPQGVQTFLMSATLTAETDTLKGLFCRNPAILELEDKVLDGGGVSQYYVKCAEDEKFLLAYVIFKLKLIKGKCIIFVGDIDRCYRLKLFFEQFGIKSCVLNSDLPVNSRIHAVEEFNKNVYDIIIAADEHEILGELGQAQSGRADTYVSVSDPPIDEFSLPTEGPEDMALSSTQVTDRTLQNDASEDKESGEPRKSERKTNRKRKEFGISRGIDFKNVACVLNFDLPTTSRSYTHRIGRTARAGKTGMAISFIVPADLYHKHKSTTFPTAKHDEEVLAKIVKHQGSKNKELRPYHFDMKQVDAFRYRMSDALRAVTRIAIREARTRELRQELLKSEKLKRHFEENPGDLHHLRHDGELRAARVQSHLKHVPEYLMPSNGKNGIVAQDLGFISMRKTTENRIRKARMQNRLKAKGKKPVGRKADPLKTFSAKGRR